METTYDLPLIDGHLHIEALGGIANVAKILDICELSGLGLMAVPFWGDENVPQNVLVLLAKAMHPEKVFAFGGLRHPRSGDVVDPLSYEEQARRLIRAGCDGIKMAEGKPNVRKGLAEALDAESYRPFYRYLEAEGIPLMLHVADPVTNWDPAEATEELINVGWFYGDGTFPSKEQIHRETEHVLDEFPGLQVTLAHFYFHSTMLDRLAGLLEQHPGMRIDITPGHEMYYNFDKQYDAARAFFQRFHERILFGTDNSTGRSSPDTRRMESARDRIEGMRRYLARDDTVDCLEGARLRGLGLGVEALGDIYTENFRRWAGQKPKPVDIPLVVEECRRLAGLSEDAGADEEILSALRQIERRLESLSG